MRFKVIDKRPVLIGSTIHKKKIGQVLEARTLKSKKAKRNPHIREPHLQLKGRIWQTLEAIKREHSSSKMKKTNLRGEEKNVQCTSSKEGKNKSWRWEKSWNPHQQKYKTKNANPGGGGFSSTKKGEKDKSQRWKKKRRKRQISEVREKKEKKTNLRGERKVGRKFERRRRSRLWSLCWKLSLRFAD